jgi:predicted HicB family RNase H-like nuclease
MAGARRKTHKRAAGEPESVRLAVNLPAYVHRRMKAKAAQRGLSIRDFILELLSRAGI